MAMLRKIDWVACKFCISCLTLTLKHVICSNNLFIHWVYMKISRYYLPKSVGLANNQLKVNKRSNLKNILINYGDNIIDI